MTTTLDALERRVSVTERLHARRSVTPARVGRSGGFFHCDHPRLVVEGEVSFHHDEKGRKFARLGLARAPSILVPCGTTTGRVSLTVELASSWEPQSLAYAVNGRDAAAFVVPGVWGASHMGLLCLSAPEAAARRVQITLRHSLDARWPAVTSLSFYAAQIWQ